MKYILIIGDGMADNPLPELDGRTVLEHADIPVMDSLASSGIIGTARTVPAGMPPGSDTATLSIFGCDPRRFYSGRAPLEAAASGIKLDTDDIAYRCNMVTLDNSSMEFAEKKLVSHSAGGIEGDISDELVSVLWNDKEFSRAANAAGIEIYPSGSFRHLAVQRNQKLQRKQGINRTQENKETAQNKENNTAIDLKPPHDHLGEEISTLLPEAAGTSTDKNAQILSNLMLLANKVLDKHPINIKRIEQNKLPANGIWFWAAGKAAVLPDFKDLYGKTGSIISAVPLCRGIGMLMGMSAINVPGATGDLHTNYEGKVDAAVNALRDNDFVTVHIEAPDECTHDGDLKGKIQAVEWIDSRVISPMVNKLKAGGIQYRMLILSDHKTLLSTRGHCADPVPFLIYDSRYDKKTSKKFNEPAAGASGNHCDDATNLMGILFDESK